MSAPPGSQYAANQLQRALDAVARGEATHERANRWRAVIDGLLSGKLSVGSRQPVARLPEWVTLEIVTGGFATGSTPAAGPLLPHEIALLEQLGLSCETSPRLALNRYFLSDVGQDRLRKAVEARHFVIEVAEEAALPTVAWLVSKGHLDIAAKLVEALAPFAAELRFYPRLDISEPVSGDLVHLEPAGVVVQRLRSIKPNRRVLAQREAVGTWTPLYDAAVTLILETVAGPLPVAEKDLQGGWSKTDRGQFVINGGWPFTQLRSDWATRARELLNQVDSARSQHQLCQRFLRPNEPFSILVQAIAQAADGPQQLASRDVGRVRLILARYLAKRGSPNSAAAQAGRERERRHSAVETHQETALKVADRLASFPPLGGLASLAAVLPSLSLSTSDEDVAPVPPGVTRRLQRCITDSPEGLIQRGVITSGEVLAKLLPQRTSQLRAASFSDTAARALYAATYRAFRRRRSLLLLNLQKQVQLEDLPWVGALERFRDDNAPGARAANEALEEFAAITIAQFPQTMLPNKLLQEFVALARDAGKSMPFTEELAADIFMGQFSQKFIEATHIAAVHLQHTLYARYYRLDYRDITNRLSAVSSDRDAAAALAAICAERAGESLGTWTPASNGRIIEQQLIITSHNMALLFELPGVRARLAGRVVELAKACFAWVLRHLQLPLLPGDWRTELHRIKNAAYAWRQMVFLLSLRSDNAPAFLANADAMLEKQPERFKLLFGPAIEGLRMAVEAPDRWLTTAEQQPFLGWKDTKRWREPAP